jgi:hypothetical protein
MKCETMGQLSILSADTWVVPPTSRYKMFGQRCIYAVAF